MDGQCMLMQRLGNEVCECMRIIIELTFLNCSYIERFTHAHLLESFARTREFLAVAQANVLARMNTDGTCKKHLRYLKSSKPQGGKQRPCVFSVGGTVVYDLVRY